MTARLWQQLFPENRDYLILIPLPLSRLQMFAAKFSALTLFIGLFVTACNLFPSLILPAMQSGKYSIHKVMVADILAHALATSAGALFVFFALMGLPWPRRPEVRSYFIGDGLGSGARPPRGMRAPVRHPGRGDALGVAEVPFVCSYLPGKKNVSVLFVAYWMAFATWERCLCGMRTSRNRWWPPSASSGGNLSRQPVASLSSIS